tara:strand:- start:421 stop:1782 length:1362 start_codon:yes stop_codon:yes gene_type:complete
MARLGFKKNNIMAETTTNYSLSSSTREAVKDAGLAAAENDKGKGYLRNAELAGGIATDIDTAQTAREVEKEKKAKEDAIKQDKIDDADIKWEDVFAKMKDGGEWASADLYADFQEDEGKFKDIYLGYLGEDPPNKKAAATALREQGERAKQLTSWKATMERSLQMSTDYDMSKIVTGDTPGAVKNRGILASLANAGGDGATMVMEDGVMKFEVEHLDENGDKVKATVSQKEIDKMMDAAVSPVIRKQMHKKQNDLYVANATDGLPFDQKAALASTTENVAVELRKNPGSAHSILHDPVVGDKSIADSITEAIRAPGTGIQFKVQIPDGKEAYDLDGSGDLSIEEIGAMTDTVVTDEDLTDDDIKKMLEELEKDPKLLAEVAGGFMAMKYKNAHKEEATRVQEVGFEKALKQARSPGVGGIKKSGLTTPGHANYDAKFTTWYNELTAEVTEESK